MGKSGSQGAKNDKKQVENGSKMGSAGSIFWLTRDQIDLGWIEGIKIRPGGAGGGSNELNQWPNIFFFGQKRAKNWPIIPVTPTTLYMAMYL